MAEIPRLLEILQLAPEKAADLQSILSDFSVLKESDKDAQRVNTAGAAFSLVFDEDATICASPHFAERNGTVWSLHCRLRPGVIVFPRTSQDVAKVLALCQTLEIKFSVRCGGHLHNPGSTSNNGGVVISMANFNAVKVSDDRTTADIGAGLTWSQAYRELDAFDLAVTGGRIPSVGVSGLLLGGGSSFHRGTKGLSCKNVIEYEVVLADSTIVKANATHNKDLFWALKGGGPNFGIVTKFTMSTLPSEIWVEVRVFASHENDHLLEAIAQFSEDAERDPKGSLVFHAVPESTLLVLLYGEGVEERPAVFNAFEGISSLSDYTPANRYSISQIMTEFDGAITTSPKNHDLRVMSSLPDLEVCKAANNCRDLQQETLKHIPGLHISLEVQPISLNTVRMTNMDEGSPLGIAEQRHQWLLILVEWSNDEDEATVRDAARKIIDEAETVAHKNGTFLDFKYSNYASRDQDPLSSYGTENLEKLRSIAKHFDPKGVFQSLQYGGWLLSRAGKELSSG